MSDSFVTLGTVVHQVLCPWDFPGKHIGVGCHFPSPGDLTECYIMGYKIKRYGYNYSARLGSRRCYGRNDFGLNLEGQPEVYLIMSNLVPYMRFLSVVNCDSTRPKIMTQQ